MSIDRSVIEIDFSQWDDWVNGAPWEGLLCAAKQHGNGWFRIEIGKDAFRLLASHPDTCSRMRAYRISPAKKDLLEAVAFFTGADEVILTDRGLNLIKYGNQ